jgi:hypothetical protein
MPGAKGADWEKFNKTFADDEIEEKKITPLSDEYVPKRAETKGPVAGANGATGTFKYSRHMARLPMPPS